MTSSPSEPITGWRSSSYASTAQPSMRQEISPAYTGTIGAAPTNPEHTSVPPEIEPSWTVGLTAS